MYFKIRGIPLVESGNSVLPFHLKKQFDVEYSCMASVVNIKTDICHNANHGLHCAQKWIRIHDDEKGVLIIPVDMPLFSVGKIWFIGLRLMCMKRSL